MMTISDIIRSLFRVSCHIVTCRSAVIIPKENNRARKSIMNAARYRDDTENCKVPIAEHDVLR